MARNFPAGVGAGSVRNPLKFVLVAMAGLLAAVEASPQSVVGRPLSAVGDDGDWPTFRHDPQLTGRSPLQGRFTQAPVVSWRIDLGASTKPVEQLRAVDLDGDGLDEILTIRDDSLACMDRRGNWLWEAANLPKVKIVDIRDFAGGGARGVFAGTSDGLESVRWMISGATGKATRLYGMRDVFGFEERMGKILPDVAGDQICAWWSGDSPEDRFGGVMRGEGFLFSFEKGVDVPKVRFEQRMKGTLYKPRHLFADYDQDGDTEMVMFSHQQAWFFDVASNALELQVHWPMIRTYWATLGVLPSEPGKAPSLYSINPHIPGAERVDIVNGAAHVAWRYVAGGREDQYQNEVKVSPGAPDPYVPMLEGSAVAVLVKIENEHRDGKSWLVVLDGRTGEKRFEAPDIAVLGYEDFDSDGTPELLIQDGSALRIVLWRADGFEDIWRGDDVLPVLEVVPPEGQLDRSDGANPKVKRATNGTDLLFQFPDGVFNCAWSDSGPVKQSRYEAIRPDPRAQPQEQVLVEGSSAFVTSDGIERFRYTARTKRSYLAPPVVVADLGSVRRILVKDVHDNLISVAEDGTDSRVLAGGVFGEWSVCDMDGDGGNEIVVGVTAADGKPQCIFLAPDGTVERRFALIENSVGMKIGPSGALGPDGARWLAIYYERGTGDRNGVVAYDGKTGEPLWMRDDFQGDSGAYGPDAKVKFVLHVPTAVFDYDGDGSDDLLAASENFYGIVSVALNKDITPVQVFSDYIPGHWQAYASPIAVDVLGRGRPQVFHHKAFANTILTDLEGQPIWHWGTSRDQTASSWPGLADLDGDGALEIIQTRVDGLLRAFDAAPTDATCPKCPPDGELTTMNHGAHVRWELSFSPPISDLAVSDIDGDGHDEILFGAGDGFLYALGEDGGVPKVEWRYEAGQISGSPVIADVDKDGFPELLVPSGDGYLHCLGTP